jgi:hypothetical protein
MMSLFGGLQSIATNVISLGEVADFGKIKLQLKNKYDAKRERE